MMDEMKLQGEVLLNTSSNQVVGVASDFTSTKKTKNMMDGKATGETHQLATYVNQ